MQRIAPYVVIVSALFALLLVVSFADTVATVRAPARPASTASSTLAVVSPLPFSLPILDESGAVATTTSVATSTPKKVTSTPAKPKPATTTPATPVVAPVPTSPALSVAEKNTALDASASVLRSALVNIICYVSAGSGLHSVSASGIFIDPKGIILTNAHVAQYLLLTDKGADCTIRTGSPATGGYEVKLIFISPAWLRANATILTQTNPIGTGEHDFALLAVTKSTTTRPLPSSFSFISLATTPPSAGTPVVIATYGAQFLASSQVQSSLFPTVVFGSVKDIFTFASTTIDVLALGGSAAAQEGSSGGGVADARGELIGTITTSTVEGSTDTRSLSAITASYIRSAYASETGEALDLLLDQPVSVSIANFAPQIPALEAILTAHLP